MQLSMVAKDNPVLQSVLGGKDYGAGMHQRANHIHPNLEGLHRNESGSCVSLIAPSKKVGIPSDIDYSFSINIPDTGNDEDVVIIHSEDMVYTPTGDGMLMGLRPDSETVPDVPGTTVQSVLDAIKSQYDRFYHWAVFRVTVSHGEVTITSVHNRKGGVIIQDGHPSKRYVQLIPWSIKNTDERIKTLERPYRYMPSSVKEAIEDIAASGYSFEESARKVNQAYDEYNRESQRRLAEKDKEESKTHTVHRTRNDNERRNVGMSASKAAFMKAMMED